MKSAKTKLSIENSFSGFLKKLENPEWQMVIALFLGLFIIILCK